MVCSFTSRWYPTFLVLSFLSVSRLATGIIEGVPGRLCPEGWTFFEDYLGGGLCVLPVDQRVSWKEADDFCTNKYAHLLKLDMINQYQYYITEESVRLGEILFDDGFQDFWTGMHVKNGRLVWSAYGPEYVKKSRFDGLPWQWAAGQPSIEKGNCGRVNLGSREEERTNTTTEEIYTVKVFNNQYNVLLDDCAVGRQFVCQRPAIPNIVRQTTNCEEGWVGNSFLPDCYKVFDASEKFSTYQVAEKECQTVGGELASVSADLDLRIATVVNDFFNNNENPIDVEGLWIQNSPEQKDVPECQALPSGISDGQIRKPMTIACDKELPFICRKSVESKTPDKLLISTIYTNQSELLNREPFTPLSVSCMLSRPPKDSEILFIETPAGIINSTENWSSTLAFDVRTSEASNTPYYFNITIPELQTPQRKRRALHYFQDGGLDARAEESDRLRRKKRQTFFPSENEILKTTGYYSCGFRSIFSPVYKDTQNVLVRYSESDLFIYVLKLTAKSGFISNEGGPTTVQDVTAFNLLKDMSYVGMIEELLGREMNSLAVETQWSQDVGMYQAVLEKISGLDFYFRVFVLIRNSRSWAPSALELEQDVMTTVENYWTQEISGSDWFDRVELRSTVACPKRLLEDKWPYLNFPATKIGDSASSEEFCYLGTVPVATAECQGDYDNGASWGPVTYSDSCMTASSGTLCPDGWERFQYGSLYTCILLVEKDYTWAMAEKHCKQNKGHLIKLDAIGEYYTYGQLQEGTTTVGQYLFSEGFKEFWSGMNVKSGRLFWDGYNPELVQRSKYDNRAWLWGSGQPSVMTGSCGKITLGNREDLQTNQNEEPITVTVFDNQYFVDLSNCDGQRKFVCQMSSVSTQLSPTGRCDEGWVSNMFLPHCYKVFNGSEELTTYYAAEKECQNVGGDLLPVSSEYDRVIATAVNDFYFSFDYDYYSESDTAGIWIHNPPDEMIVAGVCKALETGFSDGRVFDKNDVQCDTLLPFMCRKRKSITDLVNLKVESPYQDQRELLKYNPFVGLPVTFMLSRKPLATELLYVRTPDGIFNSSLNWKETLGFDVMSGTEDGHYLVKFTLPSAEKFRGLAKRDIANNVGLIREDSVNLAGNIDERIRRGFVNIIPTDIPGLEPAIPSEGEIIRTVGYYSLGLRSIFPPTFTETDPILVRYSESDLYIYTAKLRLKAEFVSENRITQEDFTSFSLLQDDSYIDLIYELANLSFLNNLKIEGLDWLPGVYIYRGVIESYSNSSLQIRVFVGILNSRSLPVEFEQTVMYVVEKYWKDQISQSNVFESVEFQSTVACPLYRMSRTLGDKMQMATLPITRIGEKAYSRERCYEKSGALASATCYGGFEEGARWGTIMFRDNCKEIPDLPESNSTKSLKELSEIEITLDNILEIITNTSYLTVPEINLTEADISYVADILYNLQLFGIIDVVQYDLVFEIVDNILDTTYGLIAKAQTLDNSANRIIKALDDLSHLLQIRGANTKRFVKDYLISEVWRQSPLESNPAVGISLINNGSNTIGKDSKIDSITEGEKVLVDDLDVGIYLPTDLIKGKISRTTFHLYGKSDLFSPVGGRYKTNSKVAAARLTLGNNPVTELGSSYVTVIFLPYESDEYLTCGFWDYYANENGGGWSTEGCSMTRENDRVICKCNHLTNFAVLIDLEGHSIPEIHKQILSIITIIGLSVSIVGMGLTILGFLMFKHLRNGRGQQVLVMLSLSMLCSSIIFLVGMDKTSNRIGCIVVAVLLHYFILVSFMWMLVEGVLQYLRFVKVLGTYIPNFLIKSTIPAWGIPLIPVIILLAIDYNMYYGGKGYCWLSVTPMLYAFIIPVGVIILANFIVFTLVLCNICRRRNKGMMVNQSERKMAFLHFQAALSIFVILGLTWVFGFLAIEDARIVFHYIFAILNAFQGLFIFLLFTAREKLIRQAWAKFLCGRKYREKTSAHSGTDTRTGRKDSQDTSGNTRSTNSELKFSNITYENGHNQNGNRG